ncbi:hypothetical protein BD311DRAFT_770370 [Dichomitus squalens]|uniref:Uncharacterized protein n=1 Tax=Dichomitus squalens TaxID=114155 RepID=A0A4Q9M696_9APHY|nr:hypothetical protein BD311DRAFT_770370 [Dichomitus squalens]
MSTGLLYLSTWSTVASTRTSLHGYVSLHSLWVSGSVRESAHCLLYFCTQPSLVVLINSIRCIPREEMVSL